jgi:hypothetical protein
MGLDRKLRSHRSTGDLNKMVMDQNEDPYEGRLAARAGVDRTVSILWPSICNRWACLIAAII